MNNVPTLRFKEFSDEWNLTNLGQVTNGFEYGMNAAATEFDGENKYIRITDIDEATSKYLNDNVVSPLGGLEDKYLVKQNDILFARTGASTGKTYLYNAKDGKLYFAGFLIRANVNSNNNSKFVFLQTKTRAYNNWVQIMSMRSGQPGINSQEYASYSFYAPSKEEQEKIASFFSLIDKKIELQTEKVEELKNYKKGIMQKMFPKKGETVPELRFAGFTNAWEQRKFKDFITKSGARNTLNGDYQAYSVSNKLGLVSQAEQFDGSRLDDLGKTSYKLVEPGDFVYNPARVNVGSIAFNNLNKTVIVSSLYVILKMSDQLDNEFVLQYIKSQEFINEVKRNTEGSVREYLFYENFKNVKFPYTPNKDEQIKIGAYFKNLDNLITLHQDKLNALNEYKKGLLQQMFI